MTPWTVRFGLSLTAPGRQMASGAPERQARENCAYLSPCHRRARGPQGRVHLRVPPPLLTVPSPVSCLPPAHPTG
jgi:hypothetical protein